MAPNLLDLTSQYGLLKNLASYLRAEDLPKLAAACKTVHNDICGNKARYNQLVEATLRCNGSSGQMWKDDLLHVLEKIYYDPKVLAEEEEELDRWLAQIKCRYETTSPSASKGCDVCGEVVCNACRFHSSYEVCSNAPLTFYDELYRSEQELCRERMSRAEWRPPYVYSADYIRILVWAVAHYCNNCRDGALAKLSKSRIHPERLKKCHCWATGSKRWVCVPCFKRISKAACEATNDELYVFPRNCANAGCGKAPSGFKGICGWCNGTYMQQFEEVVDDGKVCYRRVRMGIDCWSDP